MSIDLKAILQDRGIKFIENDENFIFSSCPVCGGVHKLYLSKKDHRWICFKCIGDAEKDGMELEKNQGKGNLYAILRLIGFTHHEVIEVMGGSGFSYIDDFDFTLIEKESQDSNAEEVKEMMLPWYFVKLDGSEENIIEHEEAYKYLLSRKVNNINLVNKFDLHYSPMNKRIFFPIRINSHTVVGYQGRDITTRHKSKHHKCMNRECSMRHLPYFSGEHTAPEFCHVCGNKLELWHYPKMLNSNHFPKKDIFMNEHFIDWDKPVSLVEGPFDSINTPNSLPLLGKFLSKYQFNLLYKNCKELILYLDGDEYGVAATQSIYAELSPFIHSIKVVLSDQHDDPGQFSYKDNEEKVQSALTFEEWAEKKGIFSLYI